MKKFFEYFIKVIKILQEADRNFQIPPKELGGGLGGKINNHVL